MREQDIPLLLDRAAIDGDWATFQKIVGQAPYPQYPRLLEAGLDSLLCNSNGWAENKTNNMTLAMARLLLDKGARITGHHFRQAAAGGRSEVLGDLARKVVKLQGHKEAARLILEHAGDKTHFSPSTNALILSAERGDCAGLTTLLLVLHKAGKAVENLGLIHKVVEREMDLLETENRIACLDVLLKAGVDVNEPNQQGDRPLHLVCSERMARALLDSGAEPRAENNKKNRPLFTLWVRRTIISADQTLSIGQALIEAGAKWTDGPTQDVLKQQLGQHDLTEWILRGRARGALETHIQRPPSSTLPTRRL